MSECLCWIFIAFAILKFWCMGWCLIELFHKWRKVPELWSIDWLDIVHRLEREFGVTLSGADFESLPPEARRALTARQLWELVARRFQLNGSEPPPDGWQRVVLALSEALNVKAERITTDARLYADLGMVYGVE